MRQMKNKVCGRLYIKAEGRLEEPLAVGSGEDEQTNNDIICGVDGEAFIPGTSLAGVLRAGLDDERAQDLFGMARGHKLKEGEAADEVLKQSRIFVYDAALSASAKESLKVRDGVRLNQNKTVAESNKFNFQIIEKGARVILRFEIVQRENTIPNGNLTIAQDQDWHTISNLLAQFNTGKLRVGAKTRKGLGKIKIEQIYEKRFALNNKQDYVEWLDWNWHIEDAFKETKLIPLSVAAEHEWPKNYLIARIRLPGTLLVRAEQGGSDEIDGEPVIKQLMGINEAGNPTAIIPGSSWAGAVRGRIASIIQELAAIKSWEDAQTQLDVFFGTWNNNQGQELLRASKVYFDNSYLMGGHSQRTTRNAVDRFTGGSAKGALYRVEPWVNGSTDLKIHWNDHTNEINNKIIGGLLIWALQDLNAGFLAIGGETGAGRGLFKLEDSESHCKIVINGQVIDDNLQRECCRQTVEWVLAGGR